MPDLSFAARRAAMLMYRADIRPARLATLSGLSTNHAGRIVSGATKTPGARNIAALARALGVPPAALEGGNAPGADLEAEETDPAKYFDLMCLTGAPDQRAEATGAQGVIARALEAVPLIGADVGDLVLIRCTAPPEPGGLVAIRKEPGLIGFRYYTPSLLFALTRTGAPWSEQLRDTQPCIGVPVGIWRDLSAGE